MKLKIIILGLLVVLTLSMVACPATTTSNNEEEKEVDTSSYAAATFVEFYTCSELEEKQHITDDIEMRTNKVITVILCSNQSTGYQWNEQADISDTTVIEQASHEFNAPVSSEPGAPGKEKYTFKALKAGTSTISLEYSQPWDGGEKAAWTCTLNVTIK